MDEPFRSGYVAIGGRPNVGKSTLLNRLIGQKVSITSPRPQTTRHRILGIKTLPRGQILYIATPGLHQGGKYAINRYMNRVAAAALEDVDAVIFMVEGLLWKAEDEHVLERLETVKRPVILAVNKVDRIRDKRDLLPHLDELSKKADFEHIIPISAVRGDNLVALENRVLELLPEGPPLFPRGPGHGSHGAISRRGDRPREAHTQPRRRVTVHDHGRDRALFRGGQASAHQRGDLGRAAGPEGHRHRQAGSDAEKGGKPSPGGDGESLRQEGILEKLGPGAGGVVG
jgi:small GTP-binding protein